MFFSIELSIEPSKSIFFVCLSLGYNLEDTEGLQPGIVKRIQRISITFLPAESKNKNILGLVITVNYKMLCVLTTL